MFSTLYNKFVGSPAATADNSLPVEFEDVSDDEDEFGSVGLASSDNHGHPYPRFKKNPGIISKAFDSAASLATLAAKVDEVRIENPADDDKEMVSSTGYITRLVTCMPKGIIDRMYQFDIATFCTGNHKFAENVQVDFKAFKSKSNPSWTVTSMQLHVSKKQEKVKETQRNKTIVVMIVGITWEHIEVKWGKKDTHQLPKSLPGGIMPTHKLKNGDWLKIHIERIYDNEDEDLEKLAFDETKAKIISIEPNRQKTIVGKITRKFNEICVDDEIYVTQDVIPGGRSLPLGTLVRCVAVDSSQKVGQDGEFPWRAVEISVSNFMQYTSDPHNRDENGFFEDSCEVNLRHRDIYDNRGGIKIKPEMYVKFQATKIGNSVAKSVTVSNMSSKTIVFQDLKFSTDGSVCRFDLELPSRESDCIRTLGPEDSYTFQVFCTPLQMGRTKEMGVFDFSDFKIARDFIVTGLTNDEELLNKIKKPDEGHMRPYYHRIRGDEQIAKVIQDNNRTRIRGTAPVRAPFFMPKRIPRYPVPNAVWDAFRKQSEDVLKRAFPNSLYTLNYSNYRERLQVALWFEEVDNDLRRRQYDMTGVRLRRCGENYTFNCPGLFDFQPPVLMGDPVEVFEDTEEHGVKFQGYIKKLEKTDVYVEFNESFNETYRGAPLKVRFCLGRLTYKRQHYAVDAAYSNLGEAFLFPFGFLDAEVQEPRIPFIEGVDDDDSGEATVSNPVKKPAAVAVKEPEHEPVGLFSKPEAFVNKKKTHEKGKRAISLRTPFTSDAPTTKFLRDVNLSWFNQKLNEEQKNAVRRILKGQARPLPYIIYGPPGTGKTVTVVEAIMQVNKLDPNSRILVTAPTNHAADVISEHLVNSGKYHPGEFIRLNGFMRHEQLLIEAIKDFCVDGEFIDSVARNRLIISTCTTPGQFFSLNLIPGHFTHVFIDEAGYCTEPESLISAVHLSLDKGGQLILAGDPNQLGPVLMSDVSAQMDLKISLLERLMQGKQGVPNIYARNPEKYGDSNCGYNPLVLTKLVRNYRAHPSLLKLPSRLFYNDDLVSCAPTNEAYELTQDPKVREKVLIAQGVPLIFHGVQGNSVRERDSPSWCNAAEVMQVVDYVRKLKMCGLAYEDIGIITPYRKQAEKLRLAMQLGLLEDEIPKVGSVEEFQGGERKVIIISTVRSLYEDKIDACVNKLGFIFNEKRFNVAITRAKSLMIIVGNPHVLVKDKRWNDLLRYCLELRAYTGCNLPPAFDEVAQKLLQELKQKEQEMPSGPMLLPDMPTADYNPDGLDEDDKFQDAEEDV